MRCHSCQHTIRQMCWGSQCWIVTLFLTFNTSQSIILTVYITVLCILWPLAMGFDSVFLQFCLWADTSRPIAYVLFMVAHSSIASARLSLYFADSLFFFSRHTFSDIGKPTSQNIPTRRGLVFDRTFAILISSKCPLKRAAPFWWSCVGSDAGGGFTGLAVGYWSESSDHSCSLFSG